MPTQPNPTNLVAYWAMDETSGNRADSHSGGYDLTDSNTVGYDTGKQSNAADAVASSNESLFRSDGTWADFLGHYDWTLCGWARPDTLGSSHRRLLCKYASGQAQILIYRHNQIGNSYLAAYVYNTSGGSANSRTTSDLSAGTWYWVAVRFDASTGQVVLRVDATNYTAGTLSGTLKDGTASLRFGNYDGAASAFWDGAWDEWSAWSAYLTDDELDWLRNGTTGRTYSEVIATPEQADLTIARFGAVTVVRRVDLRPVLSVSRVAQVSGAGVASTSSSATLTRSGGATGSGGASALGSVPLPRAGAVAVAGSKALDAGLTLARAGAASVVGGASALASAALGRSQAVATGAVGSYLASAALDRLGGLSVAQTGIFGATVSLGRQAATSITSTVIEGVARGVGIGVNGAALLAELPAGVAGGAVIMAQAFGVAAAAILETVWPSGVAGGAIIAAPPAGVEGAAVVAAAPASPEGAALVTDTTPAGTTGAAIVTDTTPAGVTGGATLD